MTDSTACTWPILGSGNDDDDDDDDDDASTEPDLTSV
jgi:hypothetical protein